MKKTRIPANHWLRTRPVAHRGFHNAEAAENSLSAFRLAIQKNYPIETDVHLTADGEIAVFHDDTLDRLCGVSKKISELTAAELKSYKLAGTDDSIPLLSEMLESVGGKVPLLIEIKDHKDIGALEEKLVLALRSYPGDFAIQSFNPLVLKKLRELAPDFLRGQLATFDYGPNTSKLRNWFLRSLRSKIFSKPDFVSYNIDALPYSRVTSKKFTLLCWTVRSESGEKKAYALGANIIFENFIPNGR